MKVKDFITYLQTLPPETKVWVVEVKTIEYMGGYGERVLLKIDDNTEFLDMRDNRFAKGKPHENDIDLFLGTT